MPEVSLRSRARAVVRAIVPSGLRRLRRTNAIERQHPGLMLGSDFPFLFSESTTFGDHCRVAPPVRIYAASIGDWSYVEHNCHITWTDVGRFTSIGPFCVIGLADHPSSGWVSTHPLFYLHRPESGYDLVDETRHEEFARTSIGNDVWIGAGVSIRGGVSVGDGAIIGAGAVVTRDVPDYAVMVGAPARIVRYRFDDDEIAFLKRLRWWDRDYAWLETHAEGFRSVSDLARTVEPNDAS